MSAESSIRGSQPQFRLHVANTPPLVELARMLVAEYGALPHTTGRWPTMAADIAALPQPYVLPRGVLLVALEPDHADPPTADDAIGCGAMITLASGVAELKRIYVRPRARRRGLGEAITLSLMSWAETIGLERVRLDTAPELVAACILYERLGFVRIPPYREGLLPDAVCYERAARL